MQARAKRERDRKRKSRAKQTVAPAPAPAHDAPPGARELVEATLEVLYPKGVPRSAIIDVAYWVALSEAVFTKALGR